MVVAFHKMPWGPVGGAEIYAQARRRVGVFVGRVLVPIKKFETNVLLEFAGLLATTEPYHGY